MHFFDYSLWNHYVKDLSMPLLSAASALSFALIRVGHNFYIVCFLSMFPFDIIEMTA